MIITGKTVKAECDNCQLRKNGSCSQLKNILCADFKAIPFISQYEKDNWPTMMDATSIRMKIGMNNQ